MYIAILQNHVSSGLQNIQNKTKDIMVTTIEHKNSPGLMNFTYLVGDFPCTPSCTVSTVGLWLWQMKSDTILLTTFVLNEKILQQFHLKVSDAYL